MRDKEIKHEEKKLRRKSRHGFWAGVVLGGLLGAVVAGGFLLTGPRAVAAGNMVVVPGLLVD